MLIQLVLNCNGVRTLLPFARSCFLAASGPTGVGTAAAAGTSELVAADVALAADIAAVGDTRIGNRRIVPAAVDVAALLAVGRSWRVDLGARRSLRCCSALLGPYARRLLVCSLAWLCCFLPRLAGLPVFFWRPQRREVDWQTDSLS